MPEATAAGTGGSRGKFGFLTKKIGPVPVWLIGAVLVGGIYWYEKYGPGASSTSTAAATPADQEPAEDLTITIDETGTGSPGGSGGGGEPQPGPKPKPKPKPKKRKPPVKGTGHRGTTRYVTVTVVKWTPTNTPWNSTLSGIAGHYHVPGGADALAKLNSIKNPNLIYPGQKIRVPVTSTGSSAAAPSDTGAETAVPAGAGPAAAMPAPESAAPPPAAKPPVVTERTARNPSETKTAAGKAAKTAPAAKSPAVKKPANRQGASRWRTAA